MVTSKMVYPMTLNILAYGVIPYVGNVVVVRFRKCRKVMRRDEWVCFVIEPFLFVVKFEKVIMFVC